MLEPSVVDHGTVLITRFSRLGLSHLSRHLPILPFCEFPSACSDVQCPSWYIETLRLNFHGYTRLQCYGPDNSTAIGRPTRYHPYQLRPGLVNGCITL